jgi:hypothetical protein
MRSAGPRWAIVVAVPLLAGAVLLMHGVDVAAHALPTAASTGAPHHDHHSGDEQCDSCPSAHPLVIACVAVAVTIAVVRRARLGDGSPPTRLGVALTEEARHRVVAVARPPDPAWVCLGVMRC